jgi:hypothetical protein
MTQITKSNSTQSFIPNYLRDTWIDKHNKTSPKPIQLPTHWNPSECSPNLEIQDGVRLLYIGLGRNILDTGAVRANYPIPFEAGIYYFEMEVIDMGERGYVQIYLFHQTPIQLSESFFFQNRNIGLGFGKKSCPLTRMPGWEDNSIGYHGDDG